MKNFTKILTLLSLSGILFAGCYTQLATRDRDYSDDQGRQVYTNDQGYSDQYQDSVYDDSSNYYGSDYYDTTGNTDNEYYDRGYRSPYYYDDFYCNYPIYSRYFWGYHPSIVFGIGWNSWFYDPFYCNYWNSWYYPGSWSCLPYYYYYPSPFFFGFNYYYDYGYPYFTHYYYTNRERTRDIHRLRDLDGLRGGRGRGSLVGNNTGSAGRNVLERSGGRTLITTGTDIRTGTINSTGTRNATGTRKEIIKKERTGNTRGNIRQQGRINPNERKNRIPSVQGRNQGNRSERYITPRTHFPNRREYTPYQRRNNSGNYVPRKNERGYYTPSGRDGTSRNYNSPRSYNPPQRSYTPPTKSYSPPTRSYSPPSHGNSGGRSSGGGSGRGRR